MCVSVFFSLHSHDFRLRHERGGTRLRFFCVDCSSPNWTKNRIATNKCNLMIRKEYTANVSIRYIGLMALPFHQLLFIVYFFAPVFNPASILHGVDIIVMWWQHYQNGNDLCACPCWHMYAVKYSMRCSRENNLKHSKSVNEFESIHSTMISMTSVGEKTHCFVARAN